MSQGLTGTAPIGTVADGDKGDIVVSASGSVWQIDTGVIVNADISATAAIDASKISESTVTKTGNYTAAAESVILCDASGGAFTITLPAVASSTGKKYDVKKIDSSANLVTVDGNASETIDGSTTIELSNQYDSLTIVCNGAAWYIL